MDFLDFGILGSLDAEIFLFARVEKVLEILFIIHYLFDEKKKNALQDLKKF